MDEFQDKTPDMTEAHIETFWFDAVMEDCKQALRTAAKYKGIFVPIFVKLGLTIAFVIYCIVSMIALIVRFADVSDIDMFWPVFIAQLPFISILFLVSMLLLMLGSAFMTAGTFNLYKIADMDRKPAASDFFAGVRKYFGKILGGMLLLDLLFLILSPILALLYLLFALVVGTLTAGWGILFLSTWLLIYLGVWRAIVVVDDRGPLDAIKAGIRFGNRYYKALFLIMLSSIIVGKYALTAFGILPTVLAGWFISGVVSTCFNLLILQAYRRRTQTDLNDITCTKAIRHNPDGFYQQHYICCISCIPMSSGFYTRLCTDLCTFMCIAALRCRLADQLPFLAVISSISSFIIHTLS